MRLHGPLELAHLIRCQSVLEESSVVFTMPLCRRRQAPDLGGSRQVHAQRKGKRKVLTEELTQAGMALSRPQEVELCGVHTLRHRLLQQSQIGGSKHDEMWPLPCGDGLPPPGAQAGDEGMLTRRRFVLAGGDPGEWGLIWCPLDTAVQTPDAQLLVSRITHHMHEDGRADVAWIERRGVRQHF